MTRREAEKMIDGAIEKKINLCNLLASETNAQPVYRVIGVIAAMDSYSKALKANLDAQGIDWKLLYHAVLDLSELEVGSIFIAPSDLDKEKES